MKSYFQFVEQQVANLLNNPILFSLPPLFFFFLIFLFKWIFTTPTTTTTRNLPPSPKKLPIIGNFHQLGKLPHQSFSSLSQIHGPLMLLHLGSVPALVLSSSDIVRHVTKNHDISFSNRPPLEQARRLLYDYKDVIGSRYGEQWRQLKSLYVMQLLSKQRVNSFRALREEETDLMINKIRESSSSSLPVDLSDVFLTLTTDVAWRASYGRKYITNKNHGKLKKLIEELDELLGAFTIGNFFPWLAWVDHISGFNRSVKRVAREVDDFLEGVIEDRMAELGTPSTGDNESFVDTLLRIQHDKSIGFSFDRDNIKGLLLDTFTAGSNTTASVLEWAMTELLKHPVLMKKLQRTVMESLDGIKVISDAHIEKMHYLKAVIRETLRFHPPLPVFLRSVLNDVEVKGYKIASGTTVFINIWGMTRDEMHWDKPNEFLPERFLNSSMEFIGNDFEFNPFGFGRRGCPGMYFSMATIHLALANLMHNFDWKLPEGMKSEDIDMTETPGVTARKQVPLKAVAIPKSI